MAAAHSATLSTYGPVDVRVSRAKAFDSRTSRTVFAPAGLRLVRSVLETNQIHALAAEGAEFPGSP